MNPPIVQRISECFIKPKHSSEEHTQPWHLTAWDIPMLSLQYSQNGLLFAKPSEVDNQEDFKIMDFLEKLKQSLSLTLVHFYPLAGRLATRRNEDSGSCVMYVDCNNSSGAGFIHAEADLRISDILSSTYVPLFVQSFIDHEGAINYEGHVRPLLTIQVTELIDGIFIGCSMNHCIADGTSYWHFFNTWSEIFQAQAEPTSISHPPIMKRWFPDGHGPIINLPFTFDEHLIGLQLKSPLLKSRFFSFSSKSIAKLKARANAECKTNMISSFQSLCALLWRCVTRARHLPHDQITSCKIGINDRSRLNPPLPQEYFGNAIMLLRPFTTAGELLENNLGWAAWLLNEAVINHDDKKIRGWLECWIKSPITFKYDPLLPDEPSVMVSSSPKFDKYGNEFGMGKAVAVLSGYANNKFNGKVYASAGREGGGSVELEVCLLPDEMFALESDNEFMDAVTL